MSRKMKTMNKRNDNKISSAHEVMKAIAATALGGIGLLLSTFILNAFLSSPPTRAEFNELKVKTEQVNISIDRRLKNLEDGQSQIINHMIKKEKNHGKGL